MITYNGIELDYKADTLQSLIIKGGLTKIENLTDRTGTSSTQFNLPRTAKNELAFDNITTEGAQSQASGAAYITIDGNVFSVGTLYVKGYDDKNFSCLFMGADNDLIKTLKGLQLSEIFPKDQQFVYLDANVKVGIEAQIKPSLGGGIWYHWGHPFLTPVQDAGDLTRDNVSPFFGVWSMLYRMFFIQGIELTSNFFTSEYGLSIDYSCFDQTHLSSNGYKNGLNQVPSSAPLSSIALDFGTALGGNNSITPTSVATGTRYVFDNPCSNFRIKGSFDYVKGELDSAQLHMIINSASGIYSSFQLSAIGGDLVEGTNYFDFEITKDIIALDWLELKLALDTTASYPLTDSSVVCNEMVISHDGIVSGDAIYWGDYITKRTQLEFLKGIIKQFNLVLDVVGDNAYLELQDGGYQPFGTATALPSIAVNSFDLTDIAQDVQDVNLDYLQSDLIHLNQKIITTNYTDTLSFFPYQEYGSFLYRLNTFANNSAETYETYFNCMLDSTAFNIKGASEVGLPAMKWDNYLSSRFKYTVVGGIYEGALALTYTNSDTTTDLLDCLVNWSEPVMIGKTWEGLFKNTLNQKKNNKIIEVVFKDELGTIVSNRKEYIFKDQVYKIVEWSYDVVSKLVKAKLIMK